MGKIIDETDHRYGKLVAIEKVGKNKHRQTLWICDCDCGGIITVAGNRLRSGHTKSCGCLVATRNGQSKRKSYQKAYRKMHKKRYKANRKVYVIVHKDKLKARRIECKKEKSLYDANYYMAHKESKKIYAVSHKEERNKRQRRKRKLNSKLRLNRNMASVVWYSLKGSKNGLKWESLVGYTVNELAKHLEKQFRDGMVWGNYGKSGWVIDHKTPIKVFNFTKPEHKDFKRCWALKNLQPLWIGDNCSKGASLDKHFQPSLLL